MIRVLFKTIVFMTLSTFKSISFTHVNKYNENVLRIILLTFFKKIYWHTYIEHKKFRVFENWTLFLLGLFYKPTLYYYYEFDSMINHLSEKRLWVELCLLKWLEDVFQTKNALKLHKIRGFTKNNYPYNFHLIFLILSNQNKI